MLSFCNLLLENPPPIHFISRETSFHIWEQCIIHAYLMKGIRRASWSKTMGGTHTLTRFLPWLHPTTLLRKQTRTFQVFFFVPKKEDKENFICNILLGKQLKKTLSIYEKDLTSFKVQWGRRDIFRYFSFGFWMSTTGEIYFNSIFLC